MMKSNVFSGFLAFLCLFSPAFCLANGSTTPETINVQHRQDTDQMHQIKSKFVYSGTLLIDNENEDEEEEDDQIRTLPLNVRADFYWDQRVTSHSESSAQAIRIFNSATASIKAGTGQTDSKLGEPNHLILSRVQTDKTDLTTFEHASVENVLSQREYELLRNPADPLTFHRMFNQKDVQVGDTWKVNDEAAASFLALDRMITNNLTLKLKSISDSKAKIHITGKVKGESDDAIVEMKVKGSATFDINQQLVTWLRMDIDNKRRLGQLAPGFDGQVKIDISLNAVKDNPKITRDAIKKQFKGKKLRFSFKLDRPKSQFSLIHEPGWRLIASEDEAAVLRYMQDGQLLAQCNVVQLPKRSSDKPFTLEQFKTEIEKAVAKGQGRIVGSSKFTNSNGLEVLRLLVDGKQADIDVRWSYYHLSSTDGRRLTAVFTIEQDMEDEFAAADRLLVNEVSFKAKPNSRAAAQPSSRQKTR